MHHLVPARNPHVGKAPRNKAQSGAVLSWHRRCWSAAGTEEAAEAARAAPLSLAQPSPESLQLHWHPQLLQQTQSEMVTTTLESHQSTFSSSSGCLTAPEQAPHFHHPFYSLVLLLKCGLNADPHPALSLGRLQGRSLLF